MPAIGRGNGTPASISDSEAPHTVAIDDEPFDSVISETTRIVYGKSALSRHQRVNRPPGQLAVPHLSPAGEAESPGLADRIRRESCSGA